MKLKYLNKDIIYLSNKDKVLKKIIDQFPKQSLNLNDNSFHALINSIIGQQISVSAANSMKKKLFALKRNITPRTIKNIKKIQKDIKNKKATMATNGIQLLANGLSLSKKGLGLLFAEIFSKK